MKKLFIGIFLVVLGCLTHANAELIDNKNGLFYDTDLDITWYNPNISDMNWDEAMDWAEGLTVGGVSGWRLPTARNRDGSYPYYGYGVVGSELGHLYYEELNNSAGGPLINTSLFSNLQPVNYWSNTVDAKFAGNAFIFNFSDGKQGHANKNNIANFSAIAVHSGNIETPPDTIVQVTIDIMPWSALNPINYKKGYGLLPVAIISSEDIYAPDQLDQRSLTLGATRSEGFDAPRQLDQRSLTFGATGNEKSLAFCNYRPKGSKRNGLKEMLVCYFYIEKTGFHCGDTEGILKGKTLSGIAVEGKDLVRIIHCK